MAKELKKSEKKKEVYDVEGIITIDDRKKGDEFDLGKDDTELDTDDDELDFDADFEFDDGGD
jgi:hypothetical protein